MYQIVAVDDSPTVLASVKLAVELRGYSLKTFRRPAEALAHLKGGGRADLVITDLNMPEMSGTEFIKNLRQIPSHRYTPVVVLTTESQQAKKEEARRAGATAWITKPFTPQQLEAVLKKLLK